MEKKKQMKKILAPAARASLRRSISEIPTAEMEKCVAVLTEKNFNVKRAMVLEKLKTLMDAQRSSLN